MNEVKQVIIIRKDLHMRAGKMAAQVAHAAMGWLTRRMQVETFGDGSALSGEVSYAELLWTTGSHRKVVCYVLDEQTLIDLSAKAEEAGLLWNLVIDEGRTEFHGQHTITALAIGPDYDEKIDPVTKDLPLY